MSQQVTVNRDHCIGSGMCLGAAPDVFDLDEASKAVVLLDDLAGHEDEVREAISVCPVEALGLAG